MPTVNFTSQLSDEYDRLFSDLEIRPEKVAIVDHISRKILENKPRYQLIASKFKNIPFFFIGIIHAMETGLRFDCHLHNGDPLTSRTVHVPAGRPAGGSPPFTFEDSAMDALTLEGSDALKYTSVAEIAFALERYNGFGYRKHHPEVNSPYLWSFTNRYTKGKFVADGEFDPDAVSQQCGAMALLFVLTRLDPINVAPSVSTASTVKADAADPKDSCTRFPKIEGPEGQPQPKDKPAPPTPPQFLGRYLQIQEGTINPQVKLVQDQLVVVGIAPAKINSSAGPVAFADGEFGPLTKAALQLFQARSANAAGEPLETDGIVGPETWAALFGPGSVGPSTDGKQQQPDFNKATLAATVIAAAHDELGVMEDPLGSNRGPRVDQYIAAVEGAPLAIPWCVCFVYFCFNQAASKLGKANPFPKTAGVLDAWERSNNLARRTTQPVNVVTADEARNDPTKVKPGSVFFMSFGGGHGHVGIVISNNNGKLETIEGNTNNGGSREGVGVFLRSKRDINTINLGYADFTQ